jgi:hypothetical protein
VHYYVVSSGHGAIVRGGAINDYAEKCTVYTCKGPGKIPNVLELLDDIVDRITDASERESGD